MKVDGGLTPQDVTKAPQLARELEEMGYDGAVTFEASHDPFFPIVAAAKETSTIEFYSGVAIAFARNPMILANIGYDVQLFTEGRFKLGLGSQIRTHIVKRFGMPWSSPAKRMREMTLAIRAIWESWEKGERLEYRGDIYQHTLMTPAFNPGPHPYGLPEIYLAGVGPKMTEVAGEVADGFLLHPFSTEKALAELTLPNLDKGLAKAGRTRDDIEFSAQVMIGLGTNAEEVARAKQAVKGQIAFYGSTPAYRPVLEVHGWGDLQTELNAMTKEGLWAEIPAKIPDEVSEAIAVTGTPDEVAAKIKARFGGFADRVTLSIMHPAGPEATKALIRDLKS